MLFKKEFLTAIEATLSFHDHYRLGNHFYIYKPEAEMLCAISFDVMNGGSYFEILGGTTALCDKIEFIPPEYDPYGKTGWLRVWCPSVWEYGCGQGLVAGDNTNLDEKGWPQRYTKAKFMPQLQKNIVLLERLIGEWDAVKDVNDYYAFAAKQSRIIRGCGLFPPVPSPSADSFFLSIRVGKMREAAVIYVDLLRKNFDQIAAIDAYLPAQSVQEAIERISALDFPLTMRGASDRRDEETKIIEKLLTEHQDGLLKEAMKRVENGRKACENFLRGCEMLPAQGNQ